MYRAVITDRGKAWLEEGGNAPTRHALASLVSPQLEAAHPRALFDAFCLRLTERLDTAQSTDECRLLWRTLRDDGLIAVGGSLHIDTGRAFALREPLVEGSLPHWGGKDDGEIPVPQYRAARWPGQPVGTPEPTRSVSG